MLRRSKLELYVSTLEALAHYGPMKLTRITYKAKMNCSPLKIILRELIKKELVEKKILKKNVVVYKATQKARTVLFEFGELKEMLPIVEKREL